MGEAVEVVEGAEDGGDDGEEAGKVEEERGEALLERVWRDERARGADDACGWQASGCRLVGFGFGVACAELSGSG